MDCSKCYMCPKAPCHFNYNNDKDQKYPTGCPTIILKEKNEEIFKKYYEEENKKIAQASAKITMDEYGGKPRVREIVDFCKEMGYQKLGLVYDVELDKEAEIFKNILDYYKFDVVPTSYDKDSSIIAYKDVVIFNNTIDQAKYLNSKETDFNILLGMNVGYDTSFIKYSNAPITVLAVKDRLLVHNPLLALYQEDGYLKKKIYTDDYDKDDRPRVKEIVDYCKDMEYKNIGLPFCVGLRKEAAIFYKILNYYGFDIVPIVCKLGSFERKTLDIKEVGVPLCNPIGQAEYLNAAKTDVNILLGLCVGHDTLFIKYSNAPITVLAVKDRLLGHNPIAALYQENGYCKKKIYTNKYDKE